MSFVDSLFSFKNKNVIICGAAGHICSEIAKAFVKLGSNLFLIDKSQKKLDLVFNEIKDLNTVSIKTYCVDTTQEKELREVKISIIKKYEIDILINGPGINSPSSFFEIDVDDWDKVIQSQLNSVFLSCKIFGESMVKNNKGSIINISSTSAGPPLSKAFAYSAAKAAITNLTKNLAREWAKDGVRVNSLRPGFFPTEWNKKNFLDENRINRILGHTPMERFGSPNELLTAILFLSSDSSTFVTGSEVTVDGGFSCMSI